MKTHFVLFYLAFLLDIQFLITQEKFIWGLPYKHLLAKGRSRDFFNFFNLNFK